MKTCKICKLTKSLTEFNPASKYKDKIYYRGECKSCNLLTQSSNQTAQIKYRNSENGRKVRKDYKKTEKCKEYNRKYDKIRGLNPERKHKQYLNLKNKLETDPLFRLKHNMRNRVRNVFKSKQWHKDNSTATVLGCTLEELKVHIESKFTEGMTWDNYGHGEGKWTLDHSYPLSLCISPEEIFQKCHFTNLQPMWYIDNIKKSNKVK